MTRLRANLDALPRPTARRFRDRADAGRALGQKLVGLRDSAPVVLAVAGGGVSVAVEVAAALGSDLDVLVVQPIRLHATSAAIGLLAEGGVVTLDPFPEGIRPRSEDLDHAIAVSRREIKRRSLGYRNGRPQPDVSGRTVILVDDGIATGRVMRAALAARHHLRPARLVVAVPVAPTLVANALRRDADEVVCVALDPTLSAVADSYDDFHPLAEAEILGALARGRADVMSQAEVVVTDVAIDIPGGRIEACLSLPRAASGIVVVPCADVVERHRARTLICSLADESLGFLVLDWTRDARRLADALERMAQAPWTEGLPLGLLALGDRGRTLVAAVAEGRPTPSLCLADDSAAAEVALYFCARFGRGLLSV